MERNMVCTRSLRSHSRIPLAEMSLESLVKRRRASPPSPVPPTVGESSSEESSEDYRENHPPAICTGSSPHTPNRFCNSSYSWLSSPFWSQNTSYDQNNPWETAPNEVIVKIFSYLKMGDLFRVAQVCSNWRNLSHNVLLWTRCNLSTHTIPLNNLLGILNNGVKYLSLAKANVSPPPKTRSKQRRHCLQLEYADLGLCSIAPPTLTRLLASCQNLTKLSLEFLKLSAGALRAVSRCKKLKVLNLAMCEGITTDCLVLVTTKCALLEELNLAWCGVGEACLQKIFPEGSESLQQLNISGGRTLQTETVSTLTHSLPNLTVLDLSDCSELSLAVLAAVAENCVKLEQLSLSRVYGITMADLLNQLDMFPCLTHLDLFPAKNGSGMSVREFTDKLSDLYPHIELDKYPLSHIARPCKSLRVGKGISVLWEQIIYS